MAESKTFTGVTAQTWERLQALGQQRHGTEFTPADDNNGTATTSTPFGKLILDYAHDPKEETITYTIVSKPMLVMSPMIWNGIETTLTNLRGDGKS
jgi:hypothetical protein